MQTPTDTQPSRFGIGRAVLYTLASFAPALLAWGYGAPLLTVSLFCYGAGVFSALIIWIMADGL